MYADFLSDTLFILSDMSMIFQLRYLLISIPTACRIQYSTVQYSTVQYSTVQYSTVQYSTVQYSTVFPKSYLAYFLTSTLTFCLTMFNIYLSI